MSKSLIIFILIITCSCHRKGPTEEQELASFDRQLNIDTEARIDAAYRQIQEECDSLMRVQVPIWVDSMLTIRDSL